MALSATICKADLNIIDMDKNYYERHSLTLARHPSETEERFMLRLLAFSLNADNSLLFTKGLSTENEPDLWQKDLTNDIIQWIDLGLPSEKRMRKACGRSKSVKIYAYGSGSVHLWWKQVSGQLARFKNLSIYQINADDLNKLKHCYQRNISAQVSLQDGEVIWRCENGEVSLIPIPMIL